MSRRKNRLMLVNILVLVMLVISVGCMSSGAPAAIPSNVEPTQPEQLPATQPPAKEAPTQPPATQPPAQPAPKLPPASIDLYLPFISDAASNELNRQLDEFRAAQPDVQVNVAYVSYSDLKQKLAVSAAAGALPGMAALDYNGVVDFAQSGFLLPLEESPDFWSMYLATAVSDNTLDGQVYAYPWQRYSCSPNYSGLVIFRTDSPDQIAAERGLGAFLSNEQNQKANLQNPDMTFYPTLRSFYDNGTVACQEVVEIKLDPALIQQAVQYSQGQAGVFIDTYQVQINPLKASALDASAVGGDSGRLVSSLAPAAAPQQYKDRQVIGSLSLDDEALAKNLGLPPGAYLIACYPDTTDCVALSEQGEPFQISGDFINRSDLPADVQTPVVAYEKGSVQACFYILRVKYCIRIF